MKKLLPDLRRDCVKIRERDELRGSCGIYDCIEAPEGLPAVFHKLCGILLLRDIGLEDLAPRALFLQLLLKLLRLCGGSVIGDQDIIAHPRKLQRACLSDAGGSAGDQCDFFHCCLSSSVLILN